MASNSGIEWTDATWNPVSGCTKVSQGCKHCYAEREWPRLSADGQPYEGRAFTDIALHPDRLDQPLRWTRPRTVFVNSVSDLFHEEIPFEFIAKVFAVMACTARHTYQVLTKRPERMREFFCEWLTDHQGRTWLEANQESDMARDLWDPEQINSLDVWPQWTPYQEGKQGGYDNCGPAFPFENVWLGVSVEDQETADERIPSILDTPAALRFVSAEPLLEALDLSRYMVADEPGGPYMTRCEYCGWIGNSWLCHTNPPECDDVVCPSCLHSIRGDDAPGLDWVIAGGESGPQARPMHPDWVRSLRDQCREAKVPFFFKQWGEWAPCDCGEEGWIPGGYKHPYLDRLPKAEGGWCHGPRQLEETGCAYIAKFGKKAAGRQLDGETWDQVPTRELAHA